MAGRPGLFDLDERYAAPSETGDPLERLASVVDFEMFRGDPDAAARRSDRSKGGRPPMDPVLMFKVLILQALCVLADGRTEFQIPLAGRRLPAIAERRDRLSFMRFPGLDPHGRIPDARTIRLFRGHPTKAKAADVQFARFDAHLKERGCLAMGGKSASGRASHLPPARRPCPSTGTPRGALRAASPSGTGTGGTRTHSATSSSPDARHRHSRLGT